MANRNNRQQASADVLSQAISAVATYAHIKGGRVSFSPDSSKGSLSRATFAAEFPSVDLTAVLVGGAAAGSFVLTGADGLTVLTTAKAAEIANDPERLARKAAAKASRIAIASAVEAAQMRAARASAQPQAE